MPRNNPTRGNGLLERFLAKKRARTADKLVPNNLRGGRILDIGCGNFPYFLSNTNFKEKYGVDKLELRPQEKITFNKINIENEPLPFPDNFFEAITF